MSFTCAFAKINNQRRCVKKETWRKRKLVFFHGGLIWELFQCENSQHQQNVLRVSFVTSHRLEVIRLRGVRRIVATLAPDDL